MRFETATCRAVWDPAPEDAQTSSTTRSCCANATARRVVHDRDVVGLFSRWRWLDLLADVGFDARSGTFVHPEVEPGRHEMLLGRRPR